MEFIYLDESGDLGFNKSKNNSKYFVITFLATNNKFALEKVVKKVHKSLRKNIKKLNGGVLHCCKEKPETRNKLLTLVSQSDCAIMAIYLNKSKVYTKLQDEKHVLYNYVTNILIDRVMRNNKFAKSKNITLVAAKRETNKFLNLNFAEYLTNQAQLKHSAKISVIIKTPAEEKNLQIADFVCWSIFKKYERGDSSYYTKIKSKVIEERALFG